MAKNRKPNLEVDRLEAIAADAAQPTEARLAAVQQISDIVDAAAAIIDAAEESDDDRARARSFQQAVATLLDGAAALRRIAFSNASKPRGPEIQ